MVSYTDDVLTICQQIQGAIDFIEANLFESVTSDTAAGSACMSVRSFHRYFPALTGCDSHEAFTRTFENEQRNSHDPEQASTTARHSVVHPSSGVCEAAVAIQDPLTLVGSSE